MSELEHNYTLDEVAERLRCHPGSVRRWIRAGEMRAAKIGINWLVPESALLEFINERMSTVDASGKSEVAQAQVQV